MSDVSLASAQRSSPDSSLRKNKCAVLFAKRALILLFAAVSIGVSFFLDAPVERWVAAHPNPVLENAARLASRFGAWPWLMLGCGICLVIARLLRRDDWARLIIVMMIACSIAGLSADILRGITGRTRPDALGIVAQGWHGIHDGSQWLVGQRAYNSFPSGHTSAAFALAVTLFLSRKWPGLALLMLATCIAASRIVLAAHHFSDVVAGAILGAGIAILVWRVWMKKIRRAG